MMTEIEKRLMQMLTANVDTAKEAWRAATGDAKHRAFLVFLARMESLHLVAKRLFPPTPRDLRVFQIPPHDQAPTMTGDSDNLHLTKTQAQQLVDRLGNMTPKLKASDERDFRRNEALRRLHLGQPASSDIRRDLIDVLDRLESHLMQYHAQANKYMTTPAHVLAYAERAAMYALRDYPRAIEGDDSAHVEGLWDAIDRVHTNARAWRKGEFKNDGTAQIAAIERITKQALQGSYSDYSDGDEVQS